MKLEKQITNEKCIWDFPLDKRFSCTKCRVAGEGDMKENLLHTVFQTI